MKNWYGLLVNGELLKVEQFDSEQLPSLDKVDDFRKWGVPYLLSATYSMIEVDVTPTIKPLRERVIKAMNMCFPDFPVDVTLSPEDQSTFWVRVFAVPNEKVKEVRAFIHELQETLFPKNEMLLLAMVKDLATTEKHYPEYMPLK